MSDAEYEQEATDIIRSILIEHMGRGGDGEADSRYFAEGIVEALTAAGYHLGGWEYKTEFDHVTDDDLDASLIFQRRRAGAWRKVLTVPDRWCVGDHDPGGSCLGCYFDSLGDGDA